MPPVLVQAKMQSFKFANDWCYTPLTIMLGGGRYIISILSWSVPTSLIIFVSFLFFLVPGVRGNDPEGAGCGLLRCGQGGMERTSRGSSEFQKLLPKSAPPALDSLVQVVALGGPFLRLVTL